jgi:rhamnosyltransferase
VNRLQALTRDARLVSIVVPTRNGAGTLPALLEALSRQRTDLPFEVIAVDSGSTDGTVDLLRHRIDRLIRIRPEEFDHGLTRNLGIEGSRGELIVLLVQDAVPASDTWLTELTAPLLNDRTVAGVFGRQTPRADASAITRYYLARWVASSDAPRTIAVADAAELDRLAPIDRLTVCAFDNVCSCIRRAVWRAHPFRSTPIAEDLAWAREVLTAGYRLVYAPRAVVVHSHDRPARYELARTYVLHRRLFELFQLRTIPTLPLLARAIASSAAVHLRCERAGTTDGTVRRGVGRALALAVAWPLGQYLGGLSAARGWKSIRARTV